jgi:hypothetical protein
VAVRRNRCLLWVLCGFLAICLAGIELPELLTLTNDTSNDFTTFLRSSKTAATVHVYVVHSQQEKTGVVHRVDYPDDSFLPVLVTVTRQPRDLLVLHSFWRT